MERFWSKVNRQGPVHPKLKTRCWIWTAFTNPAGYGYFRLNGKSERAHRVAWLLTHGKWPSPNALHACDVRNCVCPDHLFEGTQSDNSKDMSCKGRVGVSLGEKHGRHVLDLAQVRSIKRMSKGRKVNYSELARKLGVSATTVTNISKHKTWKHVRI